MNRGKMSDQPRQRQQNAPEGAVAAWGNPDFAGERINLHSNEAFRGGVLMSDFDPTYLSAETSDDPQETPVRRGPGRPRKEV